MRGLLDSRNTPLRTRLRVMISESEETEGTIMTSVQASHPQCSEIRGLGASGPIHHVLDGAGNGPLVEATASENVQLARSKLNNRVVLCRKGLWLSCRP